MVGADSNSHLMRERRLSMSKSRPRDHTVLPRWHLRDYFRDRGFKTYDLQSRKWNGRGPNTLGTVRGYYEPEIERELGKIENNALPGVMKLAKRCILSDKDRRHVARYIAASLFRNPTLFDELLPEISEGAGISMDRLTSDEALQREAHGAWLDNAPEYRLIAENIYDLSWHILYVARKPNYLLLTDRPFIVRFPTHPIEATFTFPISSEVMLRIDYDPSKQWHIEPMERKGVIQYGRMLVVRAQKFVAAPFRDSNVTRMIERLRPAETPRTA